MNFLPLYINYPSWIKPEIFPGVPVLGLIRWYGLMYIFAFGTAFIILKKLLKEGALDETTAGGTLKKATEDDIFSFIATGIVFLLIGARVFSTLVYDTTGIYWKKPWLIFWPFNSSGQFTGLAGMSYHGGFIGGLLGMIFWCKKNKRKTLRWIDAMVTAIPLGYTFGRLGNFLNGELYGRITTAPWGIIFPQADRFSSSIKWVQDFANQCGLTVTGAMVNLPRHPSQLYEAFFEGLVLFAILWLLHKKKPFDGFSSAIYTIGYGVFRFFIEYFREPDSDIGYRIASDTNAPLYMNTSLLNISTGQVLCLLMIAGGTALLVFSYLLSKKQKNAIQSK
ncbi:prolipoprotein diacylglyceryl transferase [uncultured Treponema sp.]|uniref:prolipoprotein diacylglyceryl transferase n=1 Tax=uncultured Treponema sp. TaxID=162155 RepID=UPI0015BE8362|nr:prolipoprotein diacylglyceryl transferase [uncultured Treponema sp.]